MDQIIMVDPSVVDPKSTTDFVDQLPGTVALRPMRMDMNPHLLSNAHYGTAESIYDFLAKPYPLYSSVFQSSDTSGTFARFTYLPNILSNEPYASKLKGFMGIRADLVLKLTYNSNPFQSGRYILGVVPYGGAGSNPAGTVAANMRLADLTTITQLPHVQFDLNTESSATLVVPYSCLYSHVPINSTVNANNYCLGMIFIVPYQPLVSVAGSSSVPFELFVSMTNVDLAAPVYPQMNSSPPKKSSDVTRKEQVSAKIGPVSTMATKIATATNIIGDQIPLLSALAEPVSWCAELVAGVAAVFGWSNPVVLHPAQRVTNTVYAYSNNCDAGDNSVPISLWSRNTIETMPGVGGTDIDEMSFEFLKRVPAFLQNITWNDTDAKDASLFTLNVNPFNLKNTRSSGLTSVTTMAPACFLAQIFAYYRGGIKLKFKIVKTGFHSGRLMLVFNPTVEPTPGTVTTLVNTTYINRQIIDISSQTEFEYTVPFVSLAPWRPTTGNYSSIGSVSLVVTNPLIHPATVSSSINIIVEAAGADDLEFAVPKNHNLTPTFVFDPQSNDTRSAGLIDSGEIGSSTIDANQHYAARACIGEKTVSLLSYLKSADGTASTVTSGPAITYYPWTIDTSYTNNAAVATTPDQLPDNMSVVKSLYLYNRGGVRVRFTPSVATTVDLKRAKLLNWDSSTAAYAGITTGAASGGFSHAMETYHTPRSGIEVQVPQYHRFPMRNTIVEFYCPGKYNGIQPSLFPIVSSTSLEFNMYENIPGRMLRQPADDFHCSMFLGIPPMTSF